MIVYEAPHDGVVWSIIVFMFITAVVVIGYIWSKIGTKRK